MRNLSRVILVFVLLLLVTSIVSAGGGPELESFSTIGHTLLDPPPEQKYLPSGQVKFHLFAAGYVEENFVDASPATGPAFEFEEWGIVDFATLAGANNGEMVVTTESGDAEVLFSGPFSYITIPGVQGSFEVRKGKGVYKHVNGGTYSGNVDVGAGFTVTYEPCGGKKERECDPDRCAVFGDEKLKVKKDKIEWKIKNEGRNDLTIRSITLNWLGAYNNNSGEYDNIPLKKVKLGGKTINPNPATNVPVDPPVPPFPLPEPIPPADPGKWNGTVVATTETVIDPVPEGYDSILWEEKKIKDIQIKSGKKGKLKFEFEDKEISQNPWDYTILVEFTYDDSGETCAVTFVDFDPDPPIQSAP